MVAALSRQQIEFAVGAEHRVNPSGDRILAAYTLYNLSVISGMLLLSSEKGFSTSDKLGCTTLYRVFLLTIRLEVFS